MDALDNFADTGLDTSLVTEVGHILAALANDYTSFLGRNNGPQSELRLGVLFVGLGKRFTIRSYAALVTTNIEVVHAVDKFVGIVAIVLGSRHPE
jgi:hypothetical protein